MRLSFNIHYYTSPEWQLCLCGSLPELGNWVPQQALRLQSLGNGHWQLWLNLNPGTDLLEYKYLLRSDSGQILWEWGPNRWLHLLTYPNHLLFLADQWQNPSPAEKVFYTSSFLTVLMKPGQHAVKPKFQRSERIVRLKISVPRISSRHQLCVLGNQEVLGKWDRSRPLLLDCCSDSADWVGEVDASKLSFPLIYKYGIWSLEQQQLLTLEEGFDREITEFPGFDSDFVYQKTDSGFAYPLGNWKAAGVAIRLESLRSLSGFGTGDFGDLIGLLGWAKSVGLKLLQVSPLLDTVVSPDWIDTQLPVSGMALHPIYMNLEKMGRLNDAGLMAGFEHECERLKAVNEPDFEAVLRLKSNYFRLLYRQEGEKTLNGNAFKQFFKANKEWLVPYAAFVYLRNRFATARFENWEGFRRYDKSKIETLTAPGSDCREELFIQYFIQFHLDKQLKEASSFARENEIILKGEIGLGISRTSVDTWLSPTLFNLNMNAGVHPDEFADEGKNLGFPTFNWEEMKLDDFGWWTGRMQKLCSYFDCIGIARMQDFFRVWEIPVDAVEARLGHFNPALPLSADEIEQNGVRFDYERFTQPYIRGHLLAPLFGDSTGQVIAAFLDDIGEQKYRLKESFNNQQKINSFFLAGADETQLLGDSRKTRDGLFELAANVILVSTGYNQWHPRVNMCQTSSFAELDSWTQDRLTVIYNDYFGRRHPDFWYRKGMERLAPIVSNGNKLVCAEDSEKIPAVVAKAMVDLNILSLEVQWIPKSPHKVFAHPADVGYMSVCTTSSRSMHPIQEWWIENPEKMQLFFNQELGNWGAAPAHANPAVFRQIVEQHLFSPAMWAIFPIADLLAMNGDWNRDDSGKQQLLRNGKWPRRIEQSLDELKNATDFNELIRSLLVTAGRGSDY